MKNYEVVAVAMVAYLLVTVSSDQLQALLAFSIIPLGMCSWWPLVLVNCSVLKL